MNVKLGKYNQLEVVKEVDFGVYLDGGDDGEILLPTRYVPEGCKPGDVLNVFLYLDNEERLIATTLQPLVQVDEFACLEVAWINEFGAFLNWGLMKDIFVPKSQMRMPMRVGGIYIVRIYVDERTGRVAASEKIEPFLHNDPLTVKEKEEVDLITYRRTDIGYTMIINGKHTGVLHFSDIFRNIQVGDRMKGFIKAIRPENKIDLVLGTQGHTRIGGDAGKILELLEAHGGFLPYQDKSDPDDIYGFFGISKKAFKMAIGNLFKQKRIQITDSGIKKIEDQA